MVKNLGYFNVNCCRVIASSGSGVEGIQIVEISSSSCTQISVYQVDSSAQSVGWEEH